MTIERHHVGPRLSDMVIFAPAPGQRLVYLAGQVAEDPQQDARAQTQSVLAQIDRLLAEAGSSKERILMAHVFLADMADYAGMNAAWDAWVPAGQAPSRATVEARLAKPEWKVEIVVTAALGD